MSACHCKTPRPCTDPRREGYCTVCGREILAEWATENIASLLARLEDIPDVRDDPDFEHLRRVCLAREQDGRQHFGYRYLGRDNEGDVREEIADGVNYGLFGVLQRRREGRDDHADLVLTATYHAFKWYRAICEIERRERGTD